MNTQRDAWQSILTDVARGVPACTEELLQQLAQSTHAPAAVFQSLAYVIMYFDRERAALLQRYALEQYRRAADWNAVLTCAHEALCFPALRLQALAALLEAAMHLEDAQQVSEYGRLVCMQHKNKLITRGQLCGLFFNALVPYYHTRRKLESQHLLRQALQQYDQTYSDLIYTHLQAHLYAYTSDVAQELVGERDLLARS